MFKRLSNRLKGTQARQPAPKPQPTGQTPTPDQPIPQRDNFTKYKVMGLFFCILLPAAGVVYGNIQVFPDSYGLSVLMVVISTGVAFAFTVASNWATPHTREMIIKAHFALMVVMAVNLGAHWILAREKSAAVQVTEARHLEEDRADARADRAAERQSKLLSSLSQLGQSNAALINAERRRINALNNAGGTVPKNSYRPLEIPKINLVSPAESDSEAAAAGTGSSLSVESVMEKWTPWLIWLAIADLMVSVIAYGYIGLRWEKDLNKDNIPDNLQTPRP